MVALKRQSSDKKFGEPAFMNKECLDKVEVADTVCSLKSVYQVS